MNDRNYIVAHITNMEDEIFFFVDAVHGHFDWQDLHDFIKRHEGNDGPHELLMIAKKHPNKEVYFEFELKYIEPEYQYNNTDSPPFVIPGYYRPTNAKVIEIKELEGGLGDE